VQRGTADRCASPILKVLAIGEIALVANAEPRRFAGLVADKLAPCQRMVRDPRHDC